MAKVTGIGGMFFKARDVDALRSWYAEQLGVPLEEWGSWDFPWRDRENPERVGKTVWGPFPADTDYFAPSDSTFMFNFRVDDLDAMLTQLRAAGVKVEDKVEEYEYGRFGWIIDLEGNKVELWEPKGEEGQ